MEKNPKSAGSELESLERDFADLVDAFELPPARAEEPAKRFPVTIWISPAAGARYQAIQGKTKKKFCGVLKQVFEQAIERYAERAAIQSSPSPGRKLPRGSSEGSTP